MPWHWWKKIEANVISFIDDSKHKSLNTDLESEHTAFTYIVGCEVLLLCLFNGLFSSTRKVKPVWI